MTTIELITHSFKKTFYFSGRASKKELLVFTLFSLLYMFGFLVLGTLIMSSSMVFIDSMLKSFGMNLTEGYFGYFLFILIVFLILLIPISIPMFSLLVRRLHDLNKSGWFSLIFWFSSMIPIIGPIVGLIFILILNFKNGTEGDNDFGPQTID